MKRYSALIAAGVGAAILVLQQAIAEKNWDLKVVGFSVLIAIVGAVSVNLKGKGASLLGVLGTVGYTFVTIYNTGKFTWGEFTLNAALAVFMVIASSLVPKADPPPDQED
jgi:hypothetical protein